MFSNDKPVVLCLGLGSPSSSRIARVQLAFLTETCQLLKVVCGVSISSFVMGIYYYILFCLGPNFFFFFLVLIVVLLW